MDSSSPIKYAIIGSGAIASVHATAIRDTPGAILAGVWSRNPDTSKAFAHEHGCGWFGSLDELLATPEIAAVAITTPGGSHGELAVAVARAGKHLMIEKPIEVSVARVDTIIAACKRHGVKLGGVFQYRTGEGATITKQAMESGRFGRLVQASAYVPWLRAPDYFKAAPWRGNLSLSGGGALMNQAIHAVDLLIWLAGDVAEVSARMDLRVHEGIEVEDNLVAWLKFECGALGVIQSSTCCYPGESKRIELKGEHGSVTLTDDMPTLWQFDRPGLGDEAAHRLMECHETDRHSTATVGKHGARDPKAIAMTGHTLQYADFTQAIREDREPMVNGAEGRKAIALIEAVYESARAGGAVKIVAR